MGTGRTYSAFDWREAVSCWIPNTFMKNVLTGAVMVTHRRRLFAGSCWVEMFTPAEPSVYPFWVAVARAVLNALPGAPGSQTTPARAAASAARWTRSVFAQYQLTSTTIAVIPVRTKMLMTNRTSIWPRARTRPRAWAARARKPARRWSVRSNGPIGCLS